MFQIAEVITKYFDIPRLNFYISYTQNDNALKYYELELLDFKSQLEKIKGTEIKKEEILESIKKYNEFKVILSEINELNIKKLCSLVQIFYPKLKVLFKIIKITNLKNQII
ncbi:MAG: 2-hydroxyacyl-CoA dehydratase family protein [Promethearchaeota archaeon]